MRVNIGEFVPEFAKTRLDQLTFVRNYVRDQFPLHDNPEEIELTVFWANGDGEDLVFDRLVGYPVGTDENYWLNIWRIDAGL